MSREKRGVAARKSKNRILRQDHRENPPRMEGRFLSMILVPNREGVAEARKKAEQEDKEATAS